MFSFASRTYLIQLKHHNCSNFLHLASLSLIFNHNFPLFRFDNRSYFFFRYISFPKPTAKWLISSFCLFVWTCYFLPWLSCHPFLWLVWLFFPGFLVILSSGSSDFSSLAFLSSFPLARLTFLPWLSCHPFLWLVWLLTSSSPHNLAWSNSLG